MNNFTKMSNPALDSFSKLEIFRLCLVHKDTG